MKNLELPSLWYGSMLTMMLATLFGVQLGVALYAPKPVPVRNDARPAQ